MMRDHEPAIRGIITQGVPSCGKSLGFFPKLYAPELLGSRNFDPASALIGTAPDAPAECTDPSPQRFPPYAPSLRPFREPHLPASRSPEPSIESPDPPLLPQIPAAGKYSQCRSSRESQAAKHKPFHPDR